MNYKLKITGSQHEVLKEHLYPGDELEAISVALCGRLISGGTTFFFVHKIQHVPYEHDPEHY